MAFFRFQDLRVYHKILEFARSAEVLPSIAVKDDGMSTFSGLSSAALGAAIKIAEGASMPREIFVQQVRSSKTNIRECVVLLDFAFKKNQIDETNYKLLLNELEEITKMTGALITSLHRTQASAMDENQEECKDWDN
ncbi:MAG: four helix bundle protein [Bacteroidales bacterium]